MADTVPKRAARPKDRTPAKRSSTPAVPAQIVELPGGQVALFDDPRELRKLTDSEAGQLAHHVAKGGGVQLRQLKRLAGLVAWDHRFRFADEAAYGQWLDDYAGLWGVGRASIERWRDRVERMNGLPLPAVTVARQAEQKRATATKTAGRAGGSNKMLLPPQPAAQLPDAGGTIPAGANPPGPAARHEPDAAGPALPSSPAAEDVRHLVGKITTTSAEVLARCCTAEALRAGRTRIDEARRIQEQAVVAASRNGCSHPASKLRNTGYATMCDVNKGGCGVKVR